MKLIAFVASLLALVLLPFGVAHAKPPAGSATGTSYPEKPIHVVVPFAAGGVTDTLIRPLQGPVGKSPGKTIIVDNKVGAAGAIAARGVAEAPADGYTLLVVNTGLLAITPFSQKSPGFDPVKSFVPVAGLSTAPSVLLVNPSVPVNSVRQFIDCAKANPGKLEYAVIGKGAYGDMATANFSRRAGIEMAAVPYQGNAQSTTALLTGEVKVQLTILLGAINEYTSAGRIKALGVATATPSALVPGVPTLAAELPGFDAVVYTGIVAPAGTPAAIVDKISRAIGAALLDPGIQQKMFAMGMESKPLAAAPYGERIRQEIAAFASAVKELKPE